MAGRRSKGDGSIYLRGDGRWCASVELGWDAKGNRRRKVVTARTQAEVLAKLRAVRRDVETHGDVPTRSMTLGDWLDRWMREVAAPHVKPRTLDGYADKVRLIKEAIGRQRLDKLTPQHVRQMHRHAMSDGRSSTTALHCHRVLSKALKDAVREGVALRNVAESVPAPAKEAVEVQPLTAEQGRLLLAGLREDPLRARWALALLYGVRQGEALGLTWDAVNFTEGTIDLEWQMQRLTWRHGCSPPCGRKRGSDCPLRHLGIPAGVQYRHLTGAWVLTRPKRGKRRRVPLVPVMAGFLRERLRASALDPNPYGLAFARPDGLPIAPAEDNREWHRHLAAAGLPSIRLHDARHTSATLLLEAGIDAEVIRTILGHSDVVTTRGYQTVSLEMQRRALEDVGRMLTDEPA